MESWQILSLFFVLKVSCYFSSSDLDDSCARVASCIRVARTKQKHFFEQLSGGRASFFYPFSNKCGGTPWSYRVPTSLRRPMDILWLTGG
jgi:hypothetical protein